VRRVVCDGTHVASVVDRQWPVVDLESERRRGDKENIKHHSNK
jgi:hypothetical protein